RSTPAYAGITRLHVSGRTTPEVYPRVRGDHVATTSHVSPAVWSTPAYAGITGPDHSTRSTTPVYPRVRGDHRSRARWSQGPWGLPPRTRGSPIDGATGSTRTRSTPAYAGITLPLSHDHKRAYETGPDATGFVRWEKCRHLGGGSR